MQIVTSSQQKTMDELISLDKLLSRLNMQIPEVLPLYLEQFENIVKDLEHFMTRDEIIVLIPNIRQWVCQSPLVNQVRHWPKGVQGDYKIMQQILNGRNSAEENTVAYQIEGFFLQSPVCRQKVCNIEFQSRQIERRVNSNPGSSILLLGCGASSEILKCLDVLKASSVEITLADSDEDALNTSLQNLSLIKNKVKPLHGNLYKLIKQLEGNYDLILLGDLFDSINDKGLCSVLNNLQQNLTANGKIFFTNIRNNNPFRIYMEYLADWFLIQRSEEKLESLLLGSGWKRESFTIHTDETDLRCLVEISMQRQTKKNSEYEAAYLYA